jgi:hypothetical protein
MMLRLECDFRHGLVYPAITRDAEGPVMSFAHGDAYICQRSFNNPQLWSLKSPHLPSQGGRAR